MRPDAARPSDLTIEEHLRAAQGVLLLIAELFELHSLTPDGTAPPSPDYSGRVRYR